MLHQHRNVLDGLADLGVTEARRTIRIFHAAVVSSRRFSPGFVHLEYVLQYRAKLPVRHCFSLPALRLTFPGTIVAGFAARTGKHPFSLADSILVGHQEAVFRRAGVQRAVAEVVATAIQNVEI